MVSFWSPFNNNAKGVHHIEPHFLIVMWGPRVRCHSLYYRSYMTVNTVRMEQVHKSCKETPLVSLLNQPKKVTLNERHWLRGGCVLCFR